MSRAQQSLTAPARGGDETASGQFVNLGRCARCHSLNTKECAHNPHEERFMRQVYTLAFISVVLLVTSGQAQLTGVQNTNSQQSQTYWGGGLYDDFNQKWINPAKW